MTETRKADRRPNGFWTVEAVKADAATYRSAEGWIRGSPGAYAAARKFGCRRECFDLIRAAKSAAKAGA